MGGSECARYPRRPDMYIAGRLASERRTAGGSRRSCSGQLGIRLEDSSEPPNGDEVRCMWRRRDGGYSGIEAVAVNLEHLRRHTSG